MHAKDEYTPRSFEAELDLYRQVDLNMIRRSDKRGETHE